MRRADTKYEAAHGEQTGGHPLLEVIARVIVTVEPDWRRVKPCDTDPATSTRIRKHVDVADGRLRLPAPRRSNPSMLYARADQVELEAPLARVAAMSRLRKAESARENAALAAARKRLGRLAALNASSSRRIDRIAKSLGIDLTAHDEHACPCSRERFVHTMPTIMYGKDL
jgi:hypothetical protein